MDAERCPECGAAVTGGRAGCQALYDGLAALAYAGQGSGGRSDLAFDAYCMQHPATYCRSAKSYAAHLARLCCGLEYGADPKVYRAIQRWLNGSVPLVKPAVLSERGRLTVAELAATGNPQELPRLAHAWAQNVWEAYAAQHELAREWVRQALSSGETMKRGARR